MRDELPFLLDVSRLVSRLGGGALTGIDRVEAEWLRHLQDRDHLLLCRGRRGQLLLGPSAGADLLRWLSGDMTGLDPLRGLDRWRKGPALRLRALRTLAGGAVLRTGPAGRGIAAAAIHRLGAGCCYLNLGHGNMDPGLWAGLVPLRRVVLIHDTIPLDHPEFTRRGQSDVFRARFMVATGMADLILTVSATTAAQVALWRGRLGVAHRAPIHPTPIGTRLTAPDDRGIPADLDSHRLRFVTLGTIEPRKNHALLLDVWEELARRHPASAMPELLIIGRRGWENHATFARLDALPAKGPVRELRGVDDGAVAALLSGARALLMPSKAEGFGLPLTEAAGRGVPVLASPLPATREVLGDYACYVPADDPIVWADRIEALAFAPQQRKSPLPVIGWPQHFAHVQATVGAAWKGGDDDDG